MSTVLTIVSAQMTLTFLLCLLVIASKTVGGFFASWPVFLISICLCIMIAVALVHKKELRETAPRNYIALIVMSLAMATMIASVTAVFKVLPFVTLVMGCSMASIGLLCAAMYTSSPN